MWRQATWPSILWQFEQCVASSGNVVCVLADAVYNAPGGSAAVNLPQEQDAGGVHQTTSMCVSIGARHNASVSRRSPSVCCRVKDLLIWLRWTAGILVTFSLLTFDDSCRKLMLS